MTDDDGYEPEPHYPDEPDWRARERLDAARHISDDEIHAWELDASLPAPSTYKAPAASAVVDDGDHTSWWPVNLAPLFDGTHEPPRPAILDRTDSQAILYPGKCHSFNGESESGKTWAAMIACVQVVRAGGNVLYVDFEDTADTVVSRLLALGAKPADVIARFHYIQPEEPIFTGGKASRFTPANQDLADALSAYTYTLAVIDGVTEAMTMHGLELNDNADYAAFHGAIPRRLAATGAAVVQIDHVTKSAEHRGRYALGAQHKLAAMDGAVFAFNRRRPFGLGRDGLSEVTVEKDRPGQLRQHARGKRIFDLRLDSDRRTHALSWSIDPPVVADDDADDGTDQIQEVMEQISRHLEANPQGVTKGTLRKVIPAAANRVDEAIELLRLGWVRVEHSGRAHLHVSTRPFRVGETPPGGQGEP